MTTLDDCRLLELPTVVRPQGNITPVESETTVPFKIERVYFVYDVSGGASRGGHAHRELQQLVVAVMGAFSVILDDGSRRRTVHLDRGHHGLYVPRMIWRELVDFSAGGVCMVLASRHFDDGDYVRDHDEFVATKRGRQDRADG